MNRKRLRKLADFLMTVKPERFNLRCWASNDFTPTKCGTTACACGWAPTVFPKSGITVKNNNLQYNGLYAQNAASKFFNITKKTFRYLFVFSSYKKFHDGPKYVAKRIYKLLEDSNGNPNYEVSEKRMNEVYRYGY